MFDTAFDLLCADICEFHNIIYQNITHTIAFCSFLSVGDLNK